VSLALEADANLNASLRYLDLRQRGFTGSELERIAASDHRVAVLEPDEAAIHLAACQDEAALAFAALPVPAIDVRLLPKRKPNKNLDARAGWKCFAIIGGRK